jgi:hypothetical protein
VARDSAASRPPAARGGQLGGHRPHRGPQGRQVQAVERRDRQPRRVEVERLGGDSLDHHWLQEDEQLVLAPARAHPDRAAGRHQRDRAGGGRNVPLHPVIPQVQCVRRLGEQDEHVVGQGRLVEFRSGQRTEVRGLQTDPPEPVARHSRREWEDPVPVHEPDRVAALRLVLSHHLCLPDASGRWPRRIALSAS